MDDNIYDDLFSESELDELAVNKSNNFNNSNTSLKWDGLCLVCEKEIIEYENLACDICTSFFLQTIQTNKKYICISNGPNMSCNAFQNCAYCRFQRCLNIDIRYFNCDSKTENLRSKTDSSNKNIFKPNLKNTSFLNNHINQYVSHKYIEKEPNEHDMINSYNISNLNINNSINMDINRHQSDHIMQEPSTYSSNSSEYPIYSNDDVLKLYYDKLNVANNASQCFDPVQQQLAFQAAFLDTQSCYPSLTNNLNESQINSLENNKITLQKKKNYQKEILLKYFNENRTFPSVEETEKLGLQLDSPNQAVLTWFSNTAYCLSQKSINSTDSESSLKVETTKKNKKMSRKSLPSTFNISKNNQDLDDSKGIFNSILPFTKNKLLPKVFKQRKSIDTSQLSRKSFIELTDITKDLNVKLKENQSIPKIREHIDNDKSEITTHSKENKQQVCDLQIDFNQANVSLPILIPETCNTSRSLLDSENSKIKNRKKIKKYDLNKICTTTTIPKRGNRSFDCDDDLTQFNKKLKLSASLSKDFDLNKNSEKKLKKSKSCVDISSNNIMKLDRKSYSAEPRSSKKIKPVFKKEHIELSQKDQRNYTSEEVYLKLTKKSRIQNQICLKLDLNLSNCRECSMGASSTEVCRFLGWRKINLNNPNEEDTEFLSDEDINDSDCQLWKMNVERNLLNIKKMKQYESNNMTEFERNLKVLAYLRKSFLELIEEENMASKRMAGTNVFWKRQLENVREICDQCKTSIFNGHFVCRKCGFAVCIECFNTRQRNIMPSGIKSGNDKDKNNWLFCDANPILNGKRKAHKPERMMYVYLIPIKILQSIINEFEAISKLYENELKLVDKQSNKSTNSCDDMTWICGADSLNEFLLLNCTDSDKILFDKFDQVWPYKKPVVIKNVHHRLNSDLWTPQSFMDRYGELTVDLINCENNREYKDIKMKTFWLGFENFDARLKDDKGYSTILKIKDWPPTKDFNDLLPENFADLMNNLPMHEYTHRDGSLNLASNLPKYFCKPDLGPKMYIAYSSADTPQAGTTNLHIDMSDAVNLIIYVGDTYYTSELDRKKSLKKYKKNNKKKSSTHQSQKQNDTSNVQLNDELLILFDELECGQDQVQRYINGEKPGAIWHLFKPEDANAIREFLFEYELKIKKKTAAQLSKKTMNSDMIHDQRFYIDMQMLKELKKINVEAYTILQFLGDAIFIPAGAPHQVRNINSCIKVAGDFVTPQGINECIVTTKEFRNLGDKHNNREDKLQALMCLTYKKGFA